MAVGTNIRTYFNGSWHDGDVSVMRAADHGAWLGTTIRPFSAHICPNHRRSMGPVRADYGEVDMNAYTSDIVPADLTGLSEAELRKLENKVARKHSGMVPWGTVVWAFANLAVWLSLWPLVFLGCTLFLKLLSHCDHLPKITHLLRRSFQCFQHPGSCRR